MPDEPPPVPIRGTPREHLIAAGTSLWRVHQQPFGVCDFNPTYADPHWGGNRFDGTAENPYSYLYVAPEPATALAETLLRGRGYMGRSRPVKRSVHGGMALSALRTRRALRLLTLVSATDLAAIYQDDWLLQTDADDFGKTRRWAGALWQAATWADGIIWQSRRDRPRTAVILFGDRCDGTGSRRAAVEPVTGKSLSLDDAANIDELNEMLSPYRAYIERPGVV